MSQVVSIGARRFGKTEFARRGLLAKIHIAKKQLCLEDDSYRALLFRLTGKESAGELTVEQLKTVLDEFARLGFSPVAKRPGTDNLPSDAQAGKIRALWLTLYNLGEVRDPAEEALIAYCKRQSGVQFVQWMHSHQFDNVIRGMLGWLERTPWVKPTAAQITYVKRIRLHHGVDADPSNVNYAGLAAKAETIRAQHEILGQPLSGFRPELLQPFQLDDLMVALGAACRAAKAAQESV